MGNCDDLISRQAAIDALDCINGVEEVLKSLPSAEPERKTGKWLKISPAGIYECSECGQAVMTGDIEAYKFCHGCGAKMEG
jgi:hypothetical protein